MRLAALFSGGKDSTYAAHLATQRGHDVECLLTMNPRRQDSWMYHSVNTHITPTLAQAIGIPHVMVDTTGEKEAELEDLKQALKGIDVEGVVTGAVSSTYQKTRIDAICAQLGLTHVSPLWGKPSPDLLDETIQAGMEFAVTAVAARGLDESWLGRTLDHAAARELKALSRRYGFDVCGEGGEMETLVLEAPWFDARLEVTEARKIWDGTRGIYTVEDARLVPKTGNP